VLASKVGADSNLELSPVKVKDGAVVVLVALEPLAERSSIQGTAICFPPAVDDEPTLLPPTALLPPALVEPGVEELSLEELLPLGLVAAPVLLEPLEALRESTAKSMRPEVGLTIRSLIEPMELPELLVIWAPVN